MKKRADEDLFVKTQLSLRMDLGWIKRRLLSSKLVDPLA
jgi:hypothetical protein